MSTEISKRGKAPATVRDMVLSPGFKDDLMKALPAHVLPDRFARAVMTLVNKVPKLAECSLRSFHQAMMDCASLGLMPGPLGYAYVLPFEDRKANEIKAQFIPGYRGLIDCARRSGEIRSVRAFVVHKADEFVYELGLHPDLKHRPNLEASDRGEITYAYAVADMVADAPPLWEVMSRQELDGIRARSKAKNFGPWVTDYSEMCKKTVIRRLAKTLPMSVELEDVISREDRSADDVGAYQAPERSAPVVELVTPPQEAKPEPQPQGDVIDQAEAVAEQADVNAQDAKDLQKIIQEMITKWTPQRKGAFTKACRKINLIYDADTTNISTLEAVVTLANDWTTQGGDSA